MVACSLGKIKSREKVSLPVLIINSLVPVNKGYPSGEVVGCGKVNLVPTKSISPAFLPVSYTHLTLPTKRIV